MTYRAIAEITGKSVEQVREFMDRAVVAHVEVGQRFTVRRWVVPIDGVDPGVLVMGDGMTKELAVITALRRS